MNKMDTTKDHNTEVVFGGVHLVHLFSILCCVFRGVHPSHLFSFLRCGLWWGPSCSSVLFSVLWSLVGYILFICLVFCVVVFGGVHFVHLFKTKQMNKMYPTKDTTQNTKQMNMMYPTKDNNTENQTDEQDVPHQRVFCVVVFGGVHLVHLFGFLCCGLWWGTFCSSV
jgi:mannitol-specific phosphotransferase system IIBC component